MADKKQCFVVMGFGKKTDYPTGRLLDLDKSYHSIIRPAALAAGLDCRRADEIIHSGIIDVPMFEQLLMADVVVADLSTYNCNAFYELGVRHALRPHTTITMAEDKMVYPFDANHIVIRKYQHLGEGIDYEEVERMQASLKEAIETIASKPANDSPVYEFLRNLKPPVLVSDGLPEAPAPASPEPQGTSETISAFMSAVDNAFAASDFVTAKVLLEKVRSIVPGQPYVIQKLALATYKSELPAPMLALEGARDILRELNPDVSTDTETLGLWGAIHKRRWDMSRDPKQLDIAIFAYEKGFNLKNDGYNGINLAYLLNVRSSIATDPREAITDFVLAERTRRKVISICESQLAGKTLPGKAYWILSTLAEAWLGVGDQAKSKSYQEQAAAADPQPAAWMKQTSAQQLERLSLLLSKPPAVARA